MADAFPEMIVGAGAVPTCEQACRAVADGKLKAGRFKEVIADFALYLAQKSSENHLILSRGGIRKDVPLFLSNEEIAKNQVLRAQNSLIVLSRSEVGAAAGRYFV